MTSIKFFPLDDRGLRYVERQLANGNPLAEHLLKVVPFAQGHFYAIVPVDVQGDIYDFEHAPRRSHRNTSLPVEGGYMVQVHSTRPAVAGWIHGMLASDSGLGLVCESYNLRTSDIPANVRTDTTQASYLPGRTLTGDEFVYHLAFGDDPTETVEDVLRAAYDLPVGLGVVFSPPPEIREASRGSVTELKELSLVAQSPKIAMVSAYDGESLVIWSLDGIAVPTQDPS